MPNDPARPSEAPSDEFYVGYLPMPARLKGTVRTIVAALAIGVASLAVALAFAQRAPGRGVWHEDIQDFRGTLHLGPYPRLVTPDGRTHFLVAEGKFGPGEIDPLLDAERVTLRGRLLERADVRLIELASPIEPDAAADDEPGAPGRGDGPGLPVTALGEIVDAKCFAGAMKPGDGKTHKACAILCIAGGIPPVFIASDPTSPAHGAVVRMRDGTGAWTLAPEWIGQGVRIEGRVFVQDGMRWLEVRGARPSLAANWGEGCAPSARLAKGE